MKNDDPVTLNTEPVDDPQDHLPPGWGERELRKRSWRLFEYLDRIENVPECCAGYWGLFGCHRPYCPNSPEMVGQPTEEDVVDKELNKGGGKKDA